LAEINQPLKISNIGQNVHIHCSMVGKSPPPSTRHYNGKLWRLLTLYDDEDFILSDRLTQQGRTKTITENGVHYGIEVYENIFDNLSRKGLSPDDWVQDFTSLSNEFKVEVIEEF
jgi:hypothetical protein